MSAPAKRPLSRQTYTLTRNKFLTSNEDENLKILLNRNLRSPAHRRDALMLSISRYTGGRATEILNLYPRDFDAENGAICISGIKGSNDRQIPVPKWLSYEIRNYLRGCDTSAPIFPITYNRLRQIWILYRPVDKKFHSLRHTFALELYFRTRDIKLVQLALGHRSILNTLIYVDFVYSVSELRRIVK